MQEPEGQTAVPNRGAETKNAPPVGRGVHRTIAAAYCAATLSR